MNGRIKILVACHKLDVYPSNDTYMPIHVGKALSNLELGIQTDREGINISEKNPYYCELTAMYWAWKNLKGVDIIGLCHYRRYLDFHNQCRPVFASTTFSTEKFVTLDFSVDESTLKKVRKGAVVVAEPELMNCTLKQNYCEYHVSDDFNTLKSLIVQSTDAKYVNAFENIVERGHKLNPYNMFLMRWEDFDQYCSWLFPLLEKVEEATDIASYNSFQKRIYGFMAERLFNVWLWAENKNKVEKKIIFINDQNINDDKIGPRKIIRELKRSFFCKLINILYIKIQ